MKSFSERKGLKPLKQTIQANEMTEELRNSLWNALTIAVWESDNFLSHRHGDLPGIDGFSAQLWLRYFKKPMDERPTYAYVDRSRKILKIIRDYFFAAPWHEVYDFLEFMVAARNKSPLNNPRKPHRT